MKKAFFVLVVLTLCVSAASSSFGQRDSLCEAMALNREVAKLYEQRRYAEAIPYAKKALAIYEKDPGAEHLSTVASLDNLAGLYRRMGAYDKAEPLLKRSISIDEKSLGLEHPNTADSLINLAMLYNAMGTYDRAEPLYMRSLAIREYPSAFQKEKTL